MEGNAHLLQLIRKMRSQINKLERENRALKGELRGCGQPALPARGDGSGGARRWERARGAEGPAASTASPASLQGGTAAAPAPREQTGTREGAVLAPLALPVQHVPADTAMTVRRYPTATPAPAPSSTRSPWAGRKPPSTGLLEVPGSAQPPAPPAAAQLSREQQEGLGKSPASCVSYSHPSNVKLFQDHVYKCQGKVKAVSFLLPTDMSSFAEKEGSLKSPQNQSTKHLTTITEKDM